MYTCVCVGGSALLNKYEVKKGGEFGPSEEYEAVDIHLREKRGRGEEDGGEELQTDGKKSRQTQGKMADQFGFRSKETLL